jgi:hypothetical protein
MVNRRANQLLIYAKNGHFNAIIRAPNRQILKKYKKIYNHWFYQQAVFLEKGVQKGFPPNRVVADSTH